MFVVISFFCCVCTGFLSASIKPRPPAICTELSHGMHSRMYVKETVSSIPSLNNSITHCFFHHNKNRQANNPSNGHTKTTTKKKEKKTPNNPAKRRFFRSYLFSLLVETPCKEDKILPGAGVSAGGRGMGMGLTMLLNAEISRMKDGAARFLSK